MFAGTELHFILLHQTVSNVCQPKKWQIELFGNARESLPKSIISPAITISLLLPSSEKQLAFTPQRNGVNYR